MGDSGGEFKSVSEDEDRLRTEGGLSTVSKLTWGRSLQIMDSHKGLSRLTCTN